MRRIRPRRQLQPAQRPGLVVSRRDARPDEPILAWLVRLVEIVFPELYDLPGSMGGRDGAVARVEGRVRAGDDGGVGGRDVRAALYFVERRSGGIEPAEYGIANDAAERSGKAAAGVICQGGVRGQ